MMRVTLSGKKDSFADGNYIKQILENVIKGNISIDYAEQMFFDLYSYTNWMSDIDFRKSLYNYGKKHLNMLNAISSSRYKSLLYQPLNISKERFKCFRCGHRTKESIYGFYFCKECFENAISGLDNDITFSKCSFCGRDVDFNQSERQNCMTFRGKLMCSECLVKIKLLTL